MNCLRVVLIIIWTLSTLLFTRTPPATTAAPPPTTVTSLSPLTPVSSIGGALSAGAVVNTYAYLGEGSTFTILDLSLPQGTTIIARLPMGDTINSIAVADTLAYVVTTEHMSIVDISTPAMPQEQGRLAFEGNGKTILVRGSYAYIVAGFSGLLIVNIQQPQQPRIVGQLADPDHYSTDLAFHDNMVYMAYGNQSNQTGEGTGGIHIIDITNHEDPTIIQTHTVPGPADVVTLSDSLAYIGYGVFDTFIQVVDVSTPTNPQIRQTVPTPTRIANLRVDATTMVFETFRGVLLADRAIDGTITLGTTVELPYRPSLILLDHPQLYVGGTDTTTQFTLITIERPTQPQTVSTTTFPGIANTVLVDGTTIYYGGSGLHMIDATQAHDVRMVSTYDPPHGIRDMVRQDNQLYLATEQGLAIVDIQSPAQLIQRSTVPIDGFANTLAVANQTAYVAYGQDNEAGYGLRIYDVQDVATPQEQADIPLPAYPHQVMVIDSYVYVLTDDMQGSAALVVIDPTATPPARITTLRLADNAQAMVRFGSLLYTGDFLFDVIDISNPAAPQRTNTIDLGDGVSDLVTHNNQLYGLLARRGIVHIPLIDGQPQPFRVLSDQPQWARALAISDTFVIVIDQTDGLTLFQSTSTTPIYLPLVRR